MGTVTIGTDTFTVYGDLTGAKKLHNGGGSSASAAFRTAGADSDAQKRGLVDASRLLDRQRWQGTPVSTPEIDVTLEWPRDGVVDRYGTAVSNASTPDDIIKAAYEMAAMLVEDPTIADQATSGSNVSSVGAGSAKVAFFRPTLGITGKFGTKISELIAPYLSGGTTLGAGEAYGTDDASGGTPDSSAFNSDDDAALSGNI
jgi:hypothetical protein